MEPIHILQVIGTTNLGGAESRIMDLYRHIDREKIQFDFLVHTDKPGFFAEEINGLGGHIYRLPAYRVYNQNKYIAACRRFFKEHHDFAAVHGHMTSTASIYLPIAKRAGIPVTIAHARSAGVDGGLKGMATKLLRRNLSKKTDIMLSCSTPAAEAVFGKSETREGRVMILPNAIDTDLFAYQTEQRQQIREKYHLDGQFVIGHVGRFHFAKNHAYLLDTFCEIVKKEPDSKLLLLGDGPLREEMEQRAEALEISDKVLFLGNQSPVAPYYQAMDAFVFPSRFEGMPGTVVEAQAAGLPCFVSDTVTKEVKACDLVSFLPINIEPEKWAEEVLAVQNKERNSGSEQMKKAGFDVKEEVKKYENFYLTGNISALR